MPESITHSDTIDLKPLARTDGNPVFDEPWQAQALAMADNLIKQKIFGASEWSEHLGNLLRQAEENQQPDNSDTYYRCVIVAIENMLSERDCISKSEMKHREQAWRQAYLNTPHGMPVKL